MNDCARRCSPLCRLRDYASITSEPEVVETASGRAEEKRKRGDLGDRRKLGAFSRPISANLWDTMAATWCLFVGLLREKAFSYNKRTMD